MTSETSRRREKVGDLLDRAAAELSALAGDIEAMVATIERALDTTHAAV